MSMDLRLPNITASTTEGKLQQLQSYMHQLVEQLNWALSAVETKEYTQVTTQGQPLAASAEKADPLASFNEIKGLIIKSADIVNAYYQQIERKLSGVYVAESDFGAYTQKTDHTITETSTYVESLFSDVQQIQDAVDLVESKLINVTGNIKTGILDQAEDGTPVIGLEIGQRTQKDGVEVFNQYARFTADRLSFFDKNGNEVAYISDYKLYITHIELLGKFKAGGYEIDRSVGLGFRWVGRG